MHIYNVGKVKMERRCFFGQRLEGLALGEEELKFTENYDIELVFDEEGEKTKEDKKVVDYRQALKEEERLWHNNVNLPYQKKIKRN